MAYTYDDTDKQWLTKTLADLAEQNAKEHEFTAEENENYTYACRLGIPPERASKVYRFIPIDYHELMKEAEEVLGVDNVYALFHANGGFPNITKKDPIFALLKSLMEYKVEIKEILPLVEEESSMVVKYITKALKLTKGRVVPKTAMSYADLLYDTYGEDFKNYIKFIKETYSQAKYRLPYFNLFAIFHAFRVGGFEASYSDILKTFVSLRPQHLRERDKQYRQDMLFIAHGGDIKFYRELLTEQEYNVFAENFIKNSKNAKKVKKEFYYNSYMGIIDNYTADHNSNQSFKYFCKKWGF
jgi:hypothetical protein